MKRSQCRNWKHTEMLVMKAGWRGELAMLNAKHSWLRTNAAIYLLTDNTQTKCFLEKKKMWLMMTCAVKNLAWMVKSCQSSLIFFLR